MLLNTSKVQWLMTISKLLVSRTNLLLLLSGDILSLNSEPLHNNQLQSHERMKCFNSRGLHFIYASSLLPKINEPGNIVKLYNAAS